MRYWMPVDCYNGGMEHTTLHLLYSRFIYKFLWGIRALPKILGPEPYKKRTSHGIILGEGGIKMSKSKGNVINPDDVVREYGADTLRVYEMFMGPFEQMIAWDSKGVMGARRFLEKVWGLSLRSKILNPKSQTNPKPEIQNLKLKKMLHKTIKKVSEDIENLKFNTAISSLMEFSNAWQDNPKALRRKDLQDFLKILSPFAPHLAEELWQRLGGERSVFLQKWPQYDRRLIEEKKVLLVIQINGKVRDKIEIKRGLSKPGVKKTALKSPKTSKWLKNRKIKKIVFVKDRLINFVTE